MAKIENLRPNKIGWRTILHQMLERDDIEAVVCAVRVDGRWSTTWGNEAHAGLCMAAVKLLSDVTDWIHNSSGEDDAA